MRMKEEVVTIDADDDDEEDGADDEDEQEGKEDEEEEEEEGINNNSISMKRHKPFQLSYRPPIVSWANFGLKRCYSLSLIET